MAQNNLYMEDDNMRLYIDVQPLLIDELENCKNSAAASAQSAAQSASNAQNWKNDIINYKANLENFYAQASDGINNIYNSSISELTLAKDNAISDIDTEGSAIIGNFNSSYNSAVSNIQTQGQNYINQARTYAEQAQSTVDNRVSLDHLNNSKCLFTGEETTDPETIAAICSYAHSTFDINKFTVVGSPVITNDGIASGFSSSNLITIPNKIYNADSFVINFPAFSISTTKDENLILTSTNSSYVEQLGLDLEVMNNNKLRLRISHTTAWEIIWTYDGLSNNTTYYTRLVYNNGGYKFYLSTTGLFNGEEVLVNSTTTNTKIKNFSNMCIGASTTKYFQGSIDLKQFSITVDGVEVFSGNKTGIDTIKPSNFTAITSGQDSPFVNPSLPFSDSGLTITADGVASGFSSSDYLTVAFPDVTSKNYRIDFEITYKASNPVTLYQAVFSDVPVGSASRRIALRIFNNRLQLTLSSNGSSWDIGEKYSSLSLTDGKKYKISFVRSTTNYKLLVTDIETNIEQEYINFDTTTDLYNTSHQCALGYHYTSSGDTAFLGSIDLNAFKIYVDGDLVYQPCLKIPYTEGKTDSKVVNAMYYDRVKDATDQKFFPKYYTLYENNAKARLPEGDIYGMFNRLYNLIMERTSE